MNVAYRCLRLTIHLSKGHITFVQKSYYTLPEFRTIQSHEREASMVQTLLPSCPFHNKQVRNVKTSFTIPKTKHLAVNHHKTAQIIPESLKQIT